MHIHYKNLHFTYRVFIYTYSTGFVIIIPDKMTISVVSWHQMDTRLTRFLMDTRLVLGTRLILEVLRYDASVTKAHLVSGDWSRSCRT